MNLFSKDNKKPKIGLMLSGGGAKGIYQVGVFKALYEFNLFKDINVVAGSSIGAVNTLFVMAQTPYEKIEETWQKLNFSNIFKYQNTSFAKFLKNFTNFSFYYGVLDMHFSIDEIQKVMSIEDIHQSSIKGYVVASEVQKENILFPYNTNNIKQKNFLLNEEQKPFECCLASSSFPLGFGHVNINNKKYFDGFLVNNNPIDILLEEKCDLIFTIALNKDEKFKKYIQNFNQKNIKIIDLSDYNTENKKRRSDYNKYFFLANFKKEQKEKGYLDAKKKLQVFFEKKIIDVSDQNNIQYNIFNNKENSL